MKKFLKFSISIFRSIYFLFILLILIGVVFYLGLPILGPGLPGSDNSNFVTLADWLYKWFPNIPFWYPLQGTGVSFTTFYPILNHLIVVILAKALSLPLLVVFRYYALISVVLTSVGIYFLAFRFSKSQTVAALAAIFYPLSPIAWIFLLGWGFFAEHASYIFVAPALIFFELYLTSVFTGNVTLKARIFLLLFAIFSVFTLLAHPLTFIGLISVIVPFFIVYPLLLKERSKKLFLKSLSGGGLLIGLTILLSLFWLVPFFNYQKTVNQGAATGQFVHSKPLMLQNSIYFRTFFNLDPSPVIYTSLEDKIQNRSADGWRNVSFPIAISIFALIGFIGSFFLNRKLFALGFANLLPLSIALFPDLLFFFFKTPLLSYFGNWRALIIPSRLIIPVLAGFGCYFLAYIVASPFKILSSKIKTKFLKLTTSGLFLAVSSVLTILLAMFGIYYFRNWPNNPKYLISYGTESYYSGFKPDLRNIWREEIDFCNDYIGWDKDKMPVFCGNQDIKETFWYKKLDAGCEKLKKDKVIPTKQVENLCLGKIGREDIKAIVKNCQNFNLPADLSYVCPARVKTLSEQISWNKFQNKIKISKKAEELILGDEIKLIEKIPNDKNSRLDISPGLGGLLMGIPYYRETPELGIYYNQSSLIPLMWNYQITAFYSNSGIWQQPEIIDELSKYFGIGYSLLSETNVPIEKFEKNWQRVDVNKNIFGALGLWQYKNATGLLDVTTKPVILVIGDKKAQAFFRIFHLGNIGGISYDDAILVDGGEYVDTIPANELKKFDAIIMDGYKYKNRNKAWENIDKYVKEGGALYINTGWQYASADWDGKNLPEFFPFRELEWVSVGKVDEYDLADNLLTKSISEEELSPLIYGNSPWNISSNNKENLRAWTKPVISANGKPIVTAGNYAQGKVVWTGLDLAGHIGAYNDNPEEVKLFNNLIKYLIDEKPNNKVKAGFSRTYPDKIEFSLEQDESKKIAVLWKEAYYPDFKAKLIKNGTKESIPVYKAGPGLTMFILPEAIKDSTIVYEYKTPYSTTVARLISLITFFSLIAFVIRPTLIQPFINLFHSGFNKLKLKKRILTNNTDEETEY